MHLPKFKPQYYSFIIITVLLLGIIACRDFEDCRSMYTNEVWVEFKGENILAIEELYFDKPIRQLLYDKYTQHKGTGKYLLRNLKEGKLHIPLHPKHNTVTLLFYRTQADTTKPANPDTLTIFYHTVASLLSPNCGIQQEYIIDSVQTSFAKGTIIKPSLKKTEHETSEEKKKPNVEIQY